MGQSRAFMRCVIIILMVMLLGGLGIGNITAQGPGGPHTVAGRVYTSEGMNPWEGFNGTYAAVIVQHNGINTTYVDPDGLQQDENGTYWYVVTVPEGAWETDDPYWVQVDGTGWGDVNYICTGHGNPEVSSWKLTSAGSEGRDVNTAHSIPAEIPKPLGPSNAKPIIALIFAIILGAVGILGGTSKPFKFSFSGWPQRSADLTHEIRIAGAAEMPGEAIAPLEEHICKTCGGKMQYIPQNNRWYCYACQKYEEKELPPPPAAATPEEHVCATCGGKMEYIPEQDRWYCPTCQKYEEAPEREPQVPTEDEQDIKKPPRPPPSYQYPQEQELPPPPGGE